MVPPVSDRISLVPPYSGYCYVAIRFQLRGFHALWPNFPDRSSNKSLPMPQSYNPGHAVTPPVWANPRSLATTCGITVVFSSCRYLDVSVPCVRPYRISGYLLLPDAYRSLSRPSSPLRAQASPVRSCFTFSSRVKLLVLQSLSTLLYV